MARVQPLHSSAWPARLRMVLRTVVLAAVPPLPVAIVAGWLEKVAGTSVRSSLSVSPAFDSAARYVRGLPARGDVVALAYALLVVLGFLGVPVSRVWWQRIWPPETVDDYAGQTGYWAARAVRGLAFAFAFSPLTAMVSAPYSLASQVREAVTVPARLLRRRSPGRGPAAERAGPAPRAGEPVAPPVAAVGTDIDEGAPQADMLSESSEDRPRFLNR